MKVTFNIIVSLLLIMMFSLASARTRKLFENVAVEFTEKVAEHSNLTPSNDSPENCFLSQLSIPVYKSKPSQEFAYQYLSLIDLNPALLNSHNFQNAPPIS